MVTLNMVSEADMNAKIRKAQERFDELCARIAENYAEVLAKVFCAHFSDHRRLRPYWSSHHYGESGGLCRTRDCSEAYLCCR